MAAYNELQRQHNAFRGEEEEDLLDAVEEAFANLEGLRSLNDDNGDGLNS
ncbi:hypothetical protein [Desulfacinum hydrothermale]|nr:hypothetical protein [Desulfacinum hydrothermale]